jgi:hypothetical protein
VALDDFYAYMPSHLYPRAVAREQCERANTASAAFRC